MYGVCVLVQWSNLEICLSLRCLIIPKETKPHCEGHGFVCFLLEVMNKNFKCTSGQPALCYSNKHLQNLSGLTQQRPIFFACAQFIVVYGTLQNKFSLCSGSALVLCAYRKGNREVESWILEFKCLHSIVTWRNTHRFYSHFPTHSD